MTTPTIGRQVWYHAQNTGDISAVALSAQPFAATVVHVNDETETINILVLDHVGKPHFVADCPMSQQSTDHSDVDTSAAYCTWQLADAPEPVTSKGKK